MRRLTLKDGLQGKREVHAGVAKIQLDCRTPTSISKYREPPVTSDNRRLMGSQQIYDEQTFSTVISPFRIVR